MIYVRCINCSHNYAAKDIRLLDKKHFLYMKIPFERYIFFKAMSVGF